MALRYSAVGHFVVNEGAIVLLRHFLRFLLQRLKIASVMLVVNLVIELHKLGTFPGDIVQNGFLEPASQVQVFQPEQVALILHPLENCLKVRDAGEDG